MRRCVVAGCTEFVTDGGSRCRRHDRERRNERYGGNWRNVSAAAREQHRATVGDWCEGWKTPGHPSTDLTLDHSGKVLCRSCNQRKRRLGDG